MLDGTIGMGPILTAYNLSINDGIELAKNVPCSIQSQKDWPTHAVADLFVNIDESIDVYTRTVMNEKSIADTFFIWAGAYSGLFDMGPWEIKECWTREYKTPLDSGDKERALSYLKLTSRLYFLALLKVDKKQAVLFLYDQGYFLVKEVPGLTQTLVDRILSEAATAPPSPEAVRPTTSSDDIESTPPKIDNVSLAAWRAAVAEYERVHMTRTNDALPKRMKKYLDKRSGTPYSALEERGWNLSQNEIGWKKWTP